MINNKCNYISIKWGYEMVKISGIMSFKTAIFVSIIGLFATTIQSMLRIPYNHARAAARTSLLSATSKNTAIKSCHRYPLTRNTNLDYQSQQKDKKSESEEEQAKSKKSEEHIIHQNLKVHVLKEHLLLPRLLSQARLAT